MHPQKISNTQNGTDMNDTEQESMTSNPRDNIRQMNRRVNNGQKDSVNSMSCTCNGNIEEPTQERDANTRTRYGRII